MNSHSYQEPKMFRFIKIVTALGICLASHCSAMWKLLARSKIR